MPLLETHLAASGLEQLRRLLAFQVEFCFFCDMTLVVLWLQLREKEKGGVR